MKSPGRSVPTASAAWAGHTPGPRPLPGRRPWPRVPKTRKLQVVVVLLLSLLDIVTAEPVQRVEQSPSEIKCEPGYYLSTETRDCQPCQDGKDYTSYTNQEPSCFLCSICKQDKEVKRNCTSTRNTECQCKPGTCEDENSPEFCQKCSEHTNKEGEETPCTPETNQKGVPKDSGIYGPNIGLIIGLVLPAIIVALIVIWKTGAWRPVLQCMKSIAGRGRNSESANPANVPLMEVQTSIVGNVSHHNTEPQEAVNSSSGRKLLVPANGIDPVDALKQIFIYCGSIVPFNSWNNLMRQMGLKDNDIQVVRAETQPLSEVLYQMLLKWLNQTGRSASLNDLLDALEAVGERSARDTIEDHAVKSGKFIYQKATAEPGMVTHASTEEAEPGGSL